MTAKRQRIAEYLRRLDARQHASGPEEAKQQVDEVLLEVEEELCGPDDVPMGPPREDNRRPVDGRPDVVRYRSTGHNVFIRVNGAIRIEELPSKRVVLDKPGSDMRRVDDP